MKTVDVGERYYKRTLNEFDTDLLKHHKANPRPQ